MDIRRIPLEVIQCRHCDKSFQTSEKHLCNALLCQDCFDIREVNRKGFPNIIHEKAEHNFGDKYGENRGYKTVICAGCGRSYVLVPMSLVDVSVEEQKKHWDRTLVFRRLGGKEDMPFKPIVFDYENAPKGWTNDILCKRCFDNAHLEAENEIHLMHEQKLSAPAEAPKLTTEYEEKKAYLGPILTAIFLGWILIRFIFQISEDGWAVASKQSVGGTILFILACIAAYIISAELIYTHISKALGKAMGWLLALSVIFFIIGKMPSCSSNYDRDTDVYYRK